MPCLSMDNDCGVGYVPECVVRVAVGKHVCRADRVTVNCGENVAEVMHMHEPVTL